jgi:predicted dehydrogenase
MKPDRSHRVSVIGCGHWGKNLIRNFHQLGALYGVFDNDSGQLQQIAAQYPGVRAFSSYDEVLADSDLTAVAIATPAGMHARHAVLALEAGKDIFVEKPLALYPEDGAAICDTARRTGRIAMVGHLLIHHPAVKRIREMVETGELGTLEYIYSNRVSMGKIRREENALWSFAPHDISVILYFMGQMPIQVTATGGAYLQPNIADVTLSTLLFERGARAHIFVSWLHPYKEQRLVLIGSKKMVVFEDSKPGDKLVAFDKQIALKNGNFEVSQPKGTPIPFETAEPLRLECEHFLHCVRTRATPLTPVEDGLRVLQVLQACQRSLQLNGEPVQVSSAASLKILAI